MEPPPQARVLRCCCCRVFQAHQVKKSLKWTCKVCGEQQSFLRAYSEGSGADCRRHVQNLNLLQARLLETPGRSPEEPASAGRGRNEGPGPAELVSVQVSQQGHTGLARKVRGSSHEDWDTEGSPGPGGAPCAAQQVRATPSKWVRFLRPPRSSAQTDTQPSTLLQRDPVPAGAAQAEQETPQGSNHEGRGPRTTGTLQLPGATHPPCGPERPFGVTPEQLWGTGPQAEGRPPVRGAGESPLVRLQDLFNTGEDFDDVL